MAPTPTEAAEAFPARPAAELAIAYRGFLPDGSEITFDVWGDGEASYIVRPKGSPRWGLAVPLQRQEVMR